MACLCHIDDNDYGLSLGFCGQQVPVSMLACVCVCVSTFDFAMK